MAVYTQKELKIAYKNYKAFLERLTKKEIIKILCDVAKQTFPTSLVIVHNPNAKIAKQKEE